jgi:hypothetical protein
MSTLEDVQGQSANGTFSLDPPRKCVIVGDIAGGPDLVSIQVPGFDAAVSDGWLRSGDRRDAAVMAERGFRDDCGL